MFSDCVSVEFSTSSAILSSSFETSFAPFLNSAIACPILFAREGSFVGPKTIRTMPKISIIPDDFLKMHLDRLFGGEQFMLIGNYPYNISSQIFFRMLDYKEFIPYCSGMIQKEVGERLAANPGTKAYGILSIFIQLWYDVEYLFTVDENVFSPPPKVKSAVVLMKRNSRQSLECDEELFRKIVKGTFNQRRKKLRNSIQQIVGKESPLLSDPILDKRPEQLSIEDFIELTNKVEQDLA